jgi:hypothetical protein
LSTTITGRQWLRYISLIAADPSGKGLDVSNLRIDFTVTSWLLGTPALLTARVYNLADQTALKLLAMKTVPVGMPVGSGAGPGGDYANTSKVTLEAGYQENSGIIFAGDLVQAKWGRESTTDTFVDLVAGDGFQGHTWGMINTSLASGWQASDANDRLKNAYQQYNITLNDLPEDIQQQQAPRGKVMYGMARDYRRDLARSYGMNGYVHQSTGEWLLWNKAKSTTAVVVNALTGMIGMPQQTQYGATVRMLLNPKVGPGTLVKLTNRDIQRAQFAVGTSEQTAQNIAFQQNLGSSAQPQLGPLDSADGTYKVLAVTHRGDTRGQEWYSDCALLSTSSQAGVPYIPADHIWALSLG